VKFEVGINGRGRLESCAVTVSSGYRDLDRLGARGPGRRYHLCTLTSSRPHPQRQRIVLDRLADAEKIRPISMPALHNPLSHRTGSEHSRWRSHLLR
jgi:hypothetical protein